MYNKISLMVFSVLTKGIFVTNTFLLKVQTPNNFQLKVQKMALYRHIFGVNSTLYNEVLVKVLATFFTVTFLVIMVQFITRF